MTDDIDRMKIKSVDVIKVLFSIRRELHPYISDFVEEPVIVDGMIYFYKRKNL